MNPSPRKDKTSLLTEPDNVIEGWLNPPRGFREGIDESYLYEQFVDQAEEEGSLPWLLKTYSSEEGFQRDWTSILCAIGKEPANITRPKTS